MSKIYLYGMICLSHSFLIGDEFLIPDTYREMQQKYCFPGGETGTCATVLSSLGADVCMDGNHICGGAVKTVKEFYTRLGVDISPLTFDENGEALEDYIIISGDIRTPLGTYGKFYENAKSSSEKPWSTPKEEHIRGCNAAAVDPYFFETSEKAARLCVKCGVPYVTVDCAYDSYIHKNSAVSVISGESFESACNGSTRKELAENYMQNGGGLTIITNGGGEFVYGRKGGDIKRFTPYKVSVQSTLGAGDSFKAGCVYALAQGMGDESLVSFASAVAAAAISHFPIPLYPPKKDEVYGIIKSRE